MKRSGYIKRKTPLKRTRYVPAPFSLTENGGADILRRKGIRRVSKKRVAVNRIYSAKRKAYLAQFTVCMVCAHFDSEDVHHVKGRLNGHLIDETTWLAVCRPCHDKIHTHPSWARAKGYLA